MDASGGRAAGGIGPAIGRGAALFAGLGGVLAGFAATLDWPIVGTFFGVLEGAVSGAAFGVVVAVVLASLARATASMSAARGTSGAAAGAVALLAAARYTGPVDAPRPVLLALITVAAVLGALFGPLIAFGMERAPGGRVPGDLRRRLPQFLVLGAAAGVGVGAVTGVIIGIRAYLPTAAFAAMEGAVFGVVNGLTLACLAAAALLFPRVRARR